MDLDLEGKRAAVTGSSGGIGLAIAMELARLGARVVLNGQTRQPLERARDQAEPGIAARLDLVEADLGTAEGCEAFAATVGTPDILVNNVGMFAQGSFFETEDALWERILALNVLSGVRLSRALLPKMIERGWGRVLFVSSEAAVNAPPDALPYSVTKAAMLVLSRGLAEAARGTQVTVNALMPGPTRSAKIQELMEAHADKHGVTIAEAEKAFMQQNGPQSLLQRFADVEEVAALAAFACSPAASAITGTALRCDGGMVKSIL